MDNIDFSTHEDSDSDNGPAYLTTNVNENSGYLPNENAASAVPTYVTNEDGHVYLQNGNIHSYHINEGGPTTPSSSTSPIRLPPNSSKNSTSSIPSPQNQNQNQQQSFFK